MLAKQSVFTEKNNCWDNSKGIIHQVAFVLVFFTFSELFIFCSVYIYSFLSPHSTYVYFCVCISACSLTHVSVWVSVLWCSQPSGAINHCSTEGDFTAPCEWWLSLPASFPSFSLVSHSLTLSRMSPVVSSLSSLSLMIPCLQYPCNILQRGKDSKKFKAASWLHVYVTQLHSGNFLNRQEYVCR